MQVTDVADGKIVATAGAVDEARRIVLHRPIGDVDGVELAPGFVEGNPDDDRRKVHQRIHDVLPFGAEIVGGFLERSISLPL